MEVCKALYDLGSSYFSILTKKGRWSLGEKLSFASMFTVVIPIIMGLITAIGYAGKPINPERVKDLKQNPTASANKAGETALGAMGKPAPKPIIGDWFGAIAFSAEGGLSQHSSERYNTPEALLDTKTNANNSREEVYFPVAACTTLAVAFAASADTPETSNKLTPMHHLDEYLLGKPMGRVEKGVAKLKDMIEVSESINQERILRAKKNGRNTENILPSISLHNLNLGVEDGIKIYNAMADHPIASKVIYEDSSPGKILVSTTFNVETQPASKEWYKEVLAELPAGQGAVVVMGGYSFAIRHIQSYNQDYYEIFDSHNCQPYSNQKGAILIQCRTKEQLIKNVEKIRSHLVDQEEADEKSAAEDDLMMQMSKSVTITVIS